MPMHVERESPYTQEEGSIPRIQSHISASAKDVILNLKLARHWSVGLGPLDVDKGGSLILN